MRAVLDAIRSLIYAGAFVLLWGWIGLGVQRYDPVLGIVLPGWVAPAGILLMILGGLLALACVGTFAVRGRGTPAPFDSPRELVAVGPYRNVRNPMYLGGLAVLLGFALAERSISILLLSIAWVVAAHLFVVFYEEPHLKRKFGASYENYCRAVPRWVPRRAGSPTEKR